MMLRNALQSPTMDLSLSYDLKTHNPAVTRQVKYVSIDRSKPAFMLSDSIETLTNHLLFPNHKSSCTQNHRSNAECIFQKYAPTGLRSPVRFGHWEGDSSRIILYIYCI
ncbi:hypothetical protein TNCT_68481 [Trichonephila clavata]|uniref:Uncharacterized protein n=1 Tax=Trichonephila clavata TaxID=2740835 RepID=A0A8X6KR97_TRICU|nr:hypothetical protein TNCT_68481 [Trichonephila clavata]